MSKGVKITAQNIDKNYEGVVSSYCFDDAELNPLVISVSTDLSPGCLNLIMTLERLGYDYSIIGMNEKWKSWPWRTRMYISAILALKENNLDIGISKTKLEKYMDMLPPIDEEKLMDSYLFNDNDNIMSIINEKGKEIDSHRQLSSRIELQTEIPLKNVRERLVVLVDAGDLLFLKQPKDLISAFLSYNSPIVIGAENGCCSGNYYPKHLINRREIMGEYKKMYPKTPLKFPNGGFVMGYSSAILDLLINNLHIKDDQNGYLELKIENNKWFELDNEARLIANVKFGSLFDPPSENECSQTDLWDMNIRCTSSTRYPWTIMVMAKFNDSFPCVIHFPGGNWDAYNKFCTSLLGEIAQPISSKGMVVKSIVSKAWHKSWAQPLQYLNPFKK